MFITSTKNKKIVVIYDLSYTTASQLKRQHQIRQCMDENKVSFKIAVTAVEIIHMIIYIYAFKLALVAQWLLHLSLNQEVPGSRSAKVDTGRAFVVWPGTLLPNRLGCVSKTPLGRQHLYVITYGRCQD